MGSERRKPACGPRSRARPWRRSPSCCPPSPLTPASRRAAGKSAEAKKAEPPPDYEAAFPQGSILDVELEVGGEDWDRLPRRPFEYVPAAFRCGKSAIAKVGVRVKGNSSSGVPSERKSLKIDFDRFEKGASWHGLVKLNLHNEFKDPTLMREVLAYRLFRAAGVPASRTAYARVFVTIPGRSARRLIGLYVAVEQAGGDFLKDRFADPSGTLWKGEAGSDFTWFGEDPENYGGYEIERNENRGDYAPLIEFVRLVNETPDAGLEEMFARRLDVEKFLAYTAVNALLVNLDSPAGTGHNYYVYHEPASGRFTVIPWDLNEAFGNFQMGGLRDMEALSVAEPYAGDKVLIRRVLSVKKFRDRYLEIVRKLLAGPFAPAEVAKEVDRLAALIGKAVEEDTLKSFSTEDWRRALEADVRLRGPGLGEGVFGLKPFARNRAASVLDQLAGKSKGTRLQGRSFGAPPPLSGAARGASAAAGKSLYALSTDGTLTRTDLDTMRPSASASLPRAASRGGRSVDDVLRQFDKDGDGRISEREFPSALDLFRRGDKDRDGFLDRREIDAITPKGEEPGRARAASREFVLVAGETVVAAVGPNTLYAFDAATLKPLGHNRFGGPASDPMGRKGGLPGLPKACCAVAEGDTAWILADDLVLRVDLKDLRAKADADLPVATSGREGADRLKALDTDGDGVLGEDEFRGPREVFDRADRNRDGVIDAKEVRDLPPLPGETRTAEDRSLFLTPDALVAVVEGTAWRFDRKTLELKGTAKVGEKK
ncbi:MAG: CotH kinase family protein [Planctomycetes bacterium]|jgi:hypothetical protein|nr:CotH kinase family protein [Planctomycetota bacterium]